MPDSIGLPGSNLGDLLAGAVSGNYRTPQLGAAIAQGQAMTGLRTAQTEEALLNAQREQEEASAGAGLESALGAMKNPDGSFVLSPEEAHYTALQMKFLHGGAAPALQALQEAQKLHATETLGNPAAMGTPAQTAAQQAIEGKVAPLGNVPAAYTVPAGQPQPQVHVSPVAQSKMSLEDATSLLNQMKATNPEAFKSGGMFGNLTPEQIQGLHDFIVQNPGQPLGRQWFTPGGADVAAKLVHPQTPVAAPNAAAPANSAQPGTAATAAPGGAGAAAPSENTLAASPTVAPNMSLSEQAAIRKDFANGTGAKQATSIETAFQHAQLLDEVANQLGNGSFVPTNHINMLFQRMFGSAAPQNLQTIMNFLGREAVRATVNAGAGTGEERELQVSSASSPDQIHGVAQTIRSLLGAQAHSLNLRAQRAGVDITPLMPDVMRAYGLGGGNGAVPGNPGATPGTSALAALAAAELARRGGAQPAQ